MDNKNILCAGIIFLAVIIMASFVSADYQRSSVAYTNYGSSFGGSNRVAEQKCEMGQDFIIQIAPLGCTPAVVRSDLLEEQDVTVFCQLAATKINPLIDVNAIKRVTVRNIPKSVSGIGVIPSKSALALDQKNLNSPILNNIGYLAIVIPRQKNSSAMPDFIQGTATAELEYDIKNAFGIGQSTFYLPILSDNDWENQKDRYSFWKGKGYLRAENIDENDATITISNDLGRISTLNLKSGETSGKIYLPGFDCLAGLTLKVDDLEAPGTTARLSINGGEIEAKGGEKFLNGACTVKESEKMGFVQLVSISCTDDFGKKQNFDFVISPKVKLKVNGIEGVYGVGERISTGGTKDLFVGYIGSEKGTAHVDDLYIYTFAI